MSKNYRLAIMMLFALIITLAGVSDVAWARPSYKKGTTPPPIVINLISNPSGSGTLNTGTSIIYFTGASDGCLLTAEPLTKRELRELGTLPKGFRFAGEGVNWEADCDVATSTICFPMPPGIGIKAGVFSLDESGLWIFVTTSLSQKDGGVKMLCTDGEPGPGIYAPVAVNPKKFK
jgi:hypothetical protein